jgi:hypothetical protein
MQCYRAGKQVLFLVICCVGSTSASAIVFAHATDQPQEKKAVFKPKVAVKKHTIPPSEIKALNARPAVAKADRKPFTLEEISKLAGKKLEPETELPIGKKKAAAKDVVTALNQLEESLNAYGYSLHQTLPPGAAKVPQGGVKLQATPTVEPALLAKQHAAIAADHKKVAAAADTKAKAAAAKFSKANSATALNNAKSLEAEYEKNKKSVIAALKKVNTKKLTPDEKKFYDHVENLLNKKTPLSPKTKDFATQVHNEAKETAALAAKIKFQEPELLRAVGWFTDIISFDKDLPWTWNVGSAKSIELNINGDLQLHAGLSAFSGVSMSTKGSLKVAGSVLSNAVTFLDVEASASANSNSSTTSLQLQLSAKLFGADLFTPINDSVPVSSITKSINDDFPFELTFLQTDFTIVVVPIRLELGAKGDVHITSNDLLSGSLVSSVSSLSISGGIFGQAGVDLLVAQVGVQGSVNLISENLQLTAIAGFAQPPTKFPSSVIANPHFNIDFSVHDQLSVLSGEMDGVITTEIPFLNINETLYSTTIFKFGGLSPIDGYLPGTPINIIVPQPVNALPGKN